MDVRTTYETLEEPPAARWLFGSSSASVIWLAARLWLGYEWLVAGWDKIGSESWMGDGSALAGLADQAIDSGTAGEHPRLAFGLYVDFLTWIRDSAHPWLAPTVAVAEVVIGVALLVGAFVGLAAFLGTVLHFSFVFAGAGLVNPLSLAAGILLVLAWRNAGYYGVDRFLLPALGTPWHRGRIFARHAAPPSPRPSAT